MYFLVKFVQKLNERDSLKVINLLCIGLVCVNVSCQNLKESSIDPGKVTQKNWTRSDHLLIVENKSQYSFDIEIDGVMIRSDLPPGRRTHKVLNFGAPTSLRLTAIAHPCPEEEINVTSDIDFPEASLPYQGQVVKIEFDDTTMTIKK